MHKRMLSLAMAQRNGMRCKIALKKKHSKEDLKHTLNIPKTEDN